MLPPAAALGSLVGALPLRVLHDGQLSSQYATCKRRHVLENTGFAAAGPACVDIHKHGFDHAPDVLQVHLPLGHRGTAGVK